VPWRFSDDVEPYAEAVLPLLRRDPAAYTVGLTVIDRLVAGDRFSDEPMLFGWREDGSGAISWTPPYDLLLSVVPDADELAAELRALGADLPGITGDVETIERFAAAWGEEHHVHLQLRLFVLGELRPPDPPPTGAARLGAPADLTLATSWFEAFSDELGLPDRPGARTQRSIHDGMLWLWDTGAEPVAMALRTPAAGGVSRVVGVYTPPEHRGRRYGGAVTAACAAAALAAEAERVVLFTDAENPAPNKVYERIGFRPVADHQVVRFG
jgi:RimJ/RimL family protein N-acetyltransferase